MDNEFLRYKNKPNFKSEDVSYASFGKNDNKNLKVKTADSLLSFLKEENVTNNENVLLEESAPIEKPKLGDAVNLFINLLVINVLLVYFCSLLNNILFVFTLVFLSSITIPISMIYFFYKLNTRSKINVLTVIKLLAVGALIFFIFGNVLDRALITNVNYNYIVTSIKSGLEFITVLLVCWLAVKNLKYKDIMSVMYVVSVVSGGYVMARSMVELVEIVFIRVQITDNGVVSAVGAIINNSESVKLSIEALIKNIPYLAVYKSALFMSIMVISGFALKHLMFKNYNYLTPLNLWLVMAFSLIVNAFSLLTPSIMFLRGLYIIFSILITLYVLFRVIDYSIKTENYK